MNSVPLKSIELIDLDELFQSAREIIELIPTWLSGGVYDYKVPQCAGKIQVKIHTKSHLNDDYWVSRTNNFAELSIPEREKLWSQLSRYVVGSLLSLDECHTAIEKDYIHELDRYNIHPYDTTYLAPEGYQSLTYVAELFYLLQFPLNPRRFCNLVHVIKNDTEAYVISLALDPSLVPGQSKQPKVVDAQYASIERVRYIGTDLEWTMTTCSDAKGAVPHWVARMSMNGVVAKDVPYFLNWVHSKEG